MIITVTRVGKRKDALAARYRLAFSRLPGRTFGPYSFVDARSELLLHTDCTAPQARNTILDAWAEGSVTVEI